MAIGHFRKYTPFISFPYHLPHHSFHPHTQPNEFDPKTIRIGMGQTYSTPKKRMFKLKYTNINQYKTSKNTENICVSLAL
jgi:hypothetical protein